MWKKYNSRDFGKLGKRQCQVFIDSCDGRELGMECVGYRSGQTEADRRQKEWIFRGHVNIKTDYSRIGNFSFPLFPSSLLIFLFLLLFLSLVVFLYQSRDFCEIGDWWMEVFSEPSTKATVRHSENER